MTDLAERRALAPDVAAGRDAEPAAAPQPAAPGEAGPSLRLVLASLSASAGAIHLAMAPSHAAESLVEGIGFAVAGWLQVAAAVALITRATRLRLAATALLDVALIATWALSRTAGLPFGEHAGHPETATAIDLTCVAVETALVILAAGLVATARRRHRPATTAGDGDGGPPGTDAAAPGGARPAGRGGTLLAGAASLAVVAAASAALLSPSARDHAATSHGDHMAAGHDHGAAAEDDKGLSLLHNGQHHQIEWQDLDAGTQARLDRQLAVTRDVAERHPTVADAEAGGYHRVGPYFPGIGAHYISTADEAARNPDGTMDREALLHPMAIIYDGTEPDSRVAGFMYYSMVEEEPEGFAGPNDVWHFHENLCLARNANGEIDTPFGLDNEATPEQCEAAGGQILEVSQWMVHVWSVPGYDEVDGGVFAEVNQDLTCSDGTYYQLPPDEWADHRMNVCRADAA